MTITIDLPTWEYAIRVMGGAMVIVVAIALVCLFYYLYGHVKFIITTKTIRQIFLNDWKAGNIEFHTKNQPWYLKSVAPKGQIK